MSQFLVERTLPGITPEQLRGAASAAKSTAARMAADGAEVRYLRSTFIPDGERCFCLFEAGDEDTVRAVQESAGLPFDRIVPAAHIAAEEL